MPELRHLRYFIAVAEELNFSRAAERLHIAQPPVSVAIRQLEQDVGTELLKRTTREVWLTRAGAEFLDGARRTLSELDRSVGDAQRAAFGALGTLRVAFSWSVRFETLPAVVQAFMTKQPRVELLTEEMWNARMPEALRSRAVDLAMSICPEISSELEYEPIRTERIVALVAANHRLATEEQLAMIALAKEDFILFPRQRAPRLFDLMVSQCRRAGFEPQIRSESFHTRWDTRTLSDLGGVALAPESIRGDLPPGLVVLRLDEHVEPLETAMLWPRGEDSAVAAAFRQVARRCLATEAVRAVGRPPARLSHGGALEQGPGQARG
jgi:DNA-binding transcriptional LysR family regulator